jgi:DNA repair protein RadC
MSEQKKFVPITEWALDDRPREKAMAKGVESLSDAELIAVLIGNGTVNKSALEVAQDLLLACNRSLDELARKSIKELCKQTKGIGIAKATSILVAIELGRRKSLSAAKEIATYKKAKDFVGILEPLLEDKHVEEFYVIFLNNSMRLLGYEKIGTGGYTSVVVDVRIIMSKSLEYKATRIVLAHNHPSGSLIPSESDVKMTSKVIEACKYFDILLTDHLIITNNGYYSFADEGNLH